MATLLFIFFLFYLVVKYKAEMNLYSLLSQYPSNQNISIKLEANMNYFLDSKIMLQNNLELYGQENTIKFNFSNALNDSLILLEYGDAFFSNLIFTSEYSASGSLKNLFCFQNLRSIAFQVFVFLSFKYNLLILRIARFSS